MDTIEEDFVVIGGGLMGSAAAWQLSKAGKKVHLLESQSSTYSTGSSFGETRICRSLGPRNDIFSYLHRQALIETEQLIGFLNKDSGYQHAMEDIYTDSPVTYIFDSDRKSGIKRMLEQQDDPYSFASNPDEALRLFNMVVPSSGMVIREEKKYTGTINPKALISKLHAGIKQYGNKISYETKVLGLKSNRDGYSIEIETNGLKKFIEADKVITAAGPYTGSLLSELFPEVENLIVPKRVALGFYTIKQEAYSRLSGLEKQHLFKSFPLIDLGANHVFAMIEKVSPEGIPLLKVGGHFRRDRISDVDTAWSKEIPKYEKEWGRSSLASYLKMIQVPLSADDLIYENGYSCIYSLTQSEIPVVKPLEPNLVMMGGFSGVGAKGALTYGLIASNLLLARVNEGRMYLRTKNKLGCMS